MATTLYLETANTGVYSTGNTRQYQMLDTIRGDGVVQGTVYNQAVTAGGTVDRQWTATANGDALLWISNPVDGEQNVSAGASGTVTFNLWAAEDNMNNNIQVGARLFRWSANDGTETLIASANDGVELGTGAPAAMNFTVNPAANVVLLNGDRIVVKYYAANLAATATAVGTNRCTYNGTTAGANGDSYVILTDDLTFQRRIFPST